MQNRTAVSRPDSSFQLVFCHRSGTWLSAFFVHFALPPLMIVRNDLLFISKYVALEVFVFGLLTLVCTD